MMELKKLMHEWDPLKPGEILELEFELASKENRVS